MNDQYYLSHPEPCGSCLLALRDIILQMDINIAETKKYGAPCFMYKNSNLYYLWTDKKTGHPYILMVDGHRLNHPLLETGDRKRMKILPINPNTDLPVELIREVLEEGIKLKS